MRRIFVFALLGVCGSLSLFAGVDSELLGWVPAGYAAFVGIDFDHARNSPLSQYILAKSPNGELFSPPGDLKLDDLVKSTGFDPRKDLHYMLMAINLDEVSKTSAKGADFKGDGLLVVLRAKFDQAQVNKSLEKEEHQTETYQGAQVFSFQAKDGSTMGMTFSNDGLFVVGSLKTLKKALDDKAAHAILAGETLKNVQLASDGQDFWAYSTVDGSALAKGANSTAGSNNSLPQLKALEGLTQVALGVKLGAAVDFTLDAKTKEDKDAQSLADGLRFVASMAQMQRSSSPEMAAVAQVFDGMRLDSPGNSLHFGVTIPEKTLEDLVDKGIAAQKQTKAKPSAAAKSQ